MHARTRPPRRLCRDRGCRARAPRAVTRAALARGDAPTPTVVISGATSGIGFETALLLADKVRRGRRRRRRCAHARIAADTPHDNKNKTTTEWVIISSCAPTPFFIHLLQLPKIKHTSQHRLTISQHSLHIFHTHMILQWLPISSNTTFSLTNGSSIYCL